MGQRMPFFMGEVPEYQVVGDHMHIVWREIEIVLPVSVMLAGMAGAEAAIAKWQLARMADESVVEFRPR